ncbi:MFS transporter [Aspergillus fischeri NRRL 181]|uniref:MFS transporter, putative n=1 Tax=Neosartorya fischeri (strain ATCC 1020 / DSM 3700 / CBS 544.65 / FGSC A1164 / JCM 1740 / NRRL 181 / WB 181) TaxID=331117 RepID=A1D4T7_NEOFI|nr:MFS transporter, putative [Aspergillus fischeri NRRL 181]EAW23430.1 MFS transporter, putative [Aspergillus fischeri NRRL 181]
MTSNKKSRLPPYQLGEHVSPSVHLNCVLLTTTVVNFLDLLQLSFVLFALPNIQQALGFTSEDINWVLIVYNITFAAFLLIAGQLGQRFGLEKIFIAGTATLTISNVINTTAPNKAALLAGRAISGVGAGLTAPNGLAILSNTFPDGDSRNKALAIYTACGPLGSTIGTVVGSLLAFYGLNDSSRSGWTSAAVLTGIILGRELQYVVLHLHTTLCQSPGLLYNPNCRVFSGEKNILVAGLAITAAGAVAWAFATPGRAGGTSHGEGYWYSIVAAIIFVIGSPVALVPTQSILLRQVEAGNHAVAGALFNTAYQVGASVILAGANALMNRSRENVQGVRQVTIDGYLNAFWLIAGMLGAAALTVMVCYWPGKDGLVEKQMEEAYAAEPLAVDKVEKIKDATASAGSIAETR